MSDTFVFLLLLIAALGSGLLSGVFFAFSSFIMKALTHVPDEQGISSMQTINKMVLNHTFLPTFIGTALVTVILAIYAIIDWKGLNSVYILVGSLLYLIGSFFVTIRCNVPLNNKLKHINVKNKESELFWKEYVTKWTAWNHLRTFASFIALLFFILAIYLFRYS